MNAGRVAGFCLLAFTAFSARAISVLAPNFDELVGTATQIVRVEVLGLSAQLDTSTQGPVIHTFVRCRVLRRLKGESVDPELTLRLQGGQVGELRMVVPGMPQFRVGERCVLFVADNGRAACPLVGVMHGCYRLALDPATGREHVLRDNRVPLRAVDEVALPMTGLPVQDRRVNRGLELAAFEESIAAKVQATSNARIR